MHKVWKEGAIYYNMNIRPDLSIFQTYSIHTSNPYLATASSTWRASTAISKTCDLAFMIVWDCLLRQKQYIMINKGNLS